MIQSNYSLCSVLFWFYKWVLKLLYFVKLEFGCTLLIEGCYFHFEPNVMGSGKTCHMVKILHYEFLVLLKAINLLFREFFNCFLYDTWIQSYRLLKMIRNKEKHNSFKTNILISAKLPCATCGRFPRSHHKYLHFSFLSRFRSCQFEYE